MFGLKLGKLAPATDWVRAESFALPPGGDAALDRMFRDDIAAHPGESGFRLLAIGMEAFLMRAALAEFSEHTLDLQYYIYRDDDTGALLTQALLKAADRGVRVRLLVDDLNIVRGEDDVTALDAHPRIEVRIFNPFAARRREYWARLRSFLADPVRLNRRMHNKCFIADNRCAIVGGRNVGDEYFDASRDFGFGDLDVLSVGPVTAQISASFDEFWNSAFAYPLAAVGFRAFAAVWMDRLRRRLGRHFNRMRESAYATGLRQTDLASQLLERRLALTWAKARLIADKPEKIRALPDLRLPYEDLRELGEAAKREIILVSPYFVPGRQGVGILREIRARGVRVRVLTNSLASSDVAAVHAGYSRYRAALLEMGVELYEFKPVATPGRRHKRKILFGSARSSLHAKTFVFDRAQVVIGSLNLDPRSVYLNTESALIIDSEDLAADIAESFDELVDPDYSYRVAFVPGTRASLQWLSEENGMKVVHRRDPQASIWRRLTVRLLRLLPIEDQL